MNESIQPGLATKAEVHAFSNAHNITAQNSTINIVGGDNVTNNSRLEEQDEELRKIAYWLSPHNFKTIQNDTFSRSTPGTGRSFLGSPEFQSWTSSDKAILCGVGMPGSGKTILSSIVIEYLKESCSRTSDVALVFVYCRYSDKHTIAEILAALLRQLLENHGSIILRHIKGDLYSRHKCDDTRPTENELLKILQEVVPLFLRVYIVLDALDEFSDEHRYDLLDALLSLHCCLLITTRPLKNKLIQHAPTVEIKAQDEDIRLFVSRRIERATGLQDLTMGRESVRTEIISKVQQKCNGMFLLATLQLDRLKSCTTVNSLRKSLDLLPTGLDNMYRDTVERIKAQSYEESQVAIRALMWITYALRTLRTRELCEALAISPGEANFSSDDVVSRDRLISICCGLITIDIESDTARLIHYTAQDFFKNDVDFGESQEPHAFIASACISYLTAHKITEKNFSSRWELRHFLSTQPLLCYAYHNWGMHSHICYSTHKTPNLVRLFVENVRNYPWMKDNCDLDHFGPAHLAARFGLIDVLQDVGMHHHTTSIPRRVTPLHLSSRFGYATAVKILLACPGVDVNAKDEGGGTALIQASSNGHEEVVQLLLACKSIDINAKDKCGATALIFASSNGHEAVVWLLLACNGIDVNAKDKYGNTALMRASSSLQKTMLLACNDIDISTRGRRDNAILAPGHIYGGSAILPSYNHGININRRAEDIMKPRALLVSSKGCELVIASFEHTHDGMDFTVLTTNKYSSTLSTWNWQKIARMLEFYSDADLNVNGQEGDKVPVLVLHSNAGGEINKLPLSFINLYIRLIYRPGYRAFSLAHKTAMEFLVGRNDLNMDDDAMLPSLLSYSHWCAQLNTDIHSHDPTIPSHEVLHLVRLFVNRIPDYSWINGFDPIRFELPERLGENIRFTDFPQQGNRTHHESISILRWVNPSHLLSSSGRATAVNLLIPCHGAEVDAVDEDSGKILILPSSNVEKSVAQILLGCYCSYINISDRDSAMALILGSSNGHGGVIRLLLACGTVNVNAKDEYGNTALILASSNGHEEVVQLLLACNGIDVSAKDNYGKTALILASSNGHKGVVQLLLTHDGIDINAKDKYDDTALILASSNGHEEVVRLLLACDGVELNTIDNYGDTAFILASVNGHEKVVQLLLACDGIDASPKNNHWNYANTIQALSTIVRPLTRHVGSGRLLVDCDSIDVDVIRRYGNTPLIQESSNTHRTPPKLMLAHNGIDINASSLEEDTVLARLSWKGHVIVVKLLLTSNSALDLVTKAKYTSTALVRASSDRFSLMSLRGHEGAVRLQLMDLPSIVGLGLGLGLVQNRQRPMLSY